MTVRGSGTATLRTMRARILGPVETGTNEYGHTRVQSMPIRIDALACYAWLATEQAETFGENTQGAISVLRLLCARDADVDGKCVIESVSDRRGQTVFEGPFRILGVSRKADHSVVIARAAKGGRA